jgi:phage FluMu gp28-like protein
VAVDEAAQAPDLETAWQQAIRATLTDRRGDAWVLSTPKGIANYFHTLYQRGQDPEQPDWASWQMPTSMNTFIDPAEIADAQRELAGLAFDQEYLAEFVSWEGSVFRKIQEAIIEVPEWLRNPGRPSPWTISWPTFAIGVDWGRTNDYTVFTVLARVPGLPYVLAVEVDRFRGMEYALQRARLQAIWSRFGRPFVIAEANSIGSPNIEQLRRDGIPVTGFQTTNATKSRIIQDIALAFEQGTLKIPNHPALIGELQSFESRTLPSSGLVQYSAPAAGHDDTVLSLAIGYYGLTRLAGAYWRDPTDPRYVAAQREFALKFLA